MVQAIPKISDGKVGSFEYIYIIYIYICLAVYFLLLKNWMDEELCQVAFAKGLGSIQLSNFMFGALKY